MRVVFKTDRNQTEGIMDLVNKGKHETAAFSQSTERHCVSVIVSKAAVSSIFPGIGTGTYLLPKDLRMDLWPPGSGGHHFWCQGKKAFGSKMAIPYPTGGLPAPVLMGHLFFL